MKIDRKLQPPCCNPRAFFKLSVEKTSIFSQSKSPYHSNCWDRRSLKSAGISTRSQCKVLHRNVKRFLSTLCCFGVTVAVLCPGGSAELPSICAVAQKASLRTSTNIGCRSEHCMLSSEDGENMVIQSGGWCLNEGCLMLLS